MFCWTGGCRPVEGTQIRHADEYHIISSCGACSSTAVLLLQQHLVALYLVQNYSGSNRLQALKQHALRHHLLSLSLEENAAIYPYCCRTHHENDSPSLNPPHPVPRMTSFCFCCLPSAASALDDTPRSAALPTPTWSTRLVDVDSIITGEVQTPAPPSVLSQLLPGRVDENAARFSRHPRPKRVFRVGRGAKREQESPPFMVNSDWLIIFRVNDDWLIVFSSPREIFLVYACSLRSA